VLRRVVALCVLVACWGSAALAWSAPPSWKKLYRREGITVFAKERPEHPLPVLKGVGVIPANLYLLLALIDDVPRHREWVFRLEESRFLERPDPLHAVAYLRFDFPWPTSDRDGIVRVVVKRRWKPHHEVWIHFERTPHAKKPKRSGVVRVPRSKGFTRLRWMGPNKTHIVYQVDTDPGGWLPKWLVRWISRDLPLRILKGLRRQLKRRANDYGPFLRQWDPRLTWQADAPEVFSMPGVSPSELVKAPQAPTPAPRSP